jgi:hypothetical protein
MREHVSTSIHATIDVRYRRVTHTTPRVSNESDLSSDLRVGVEERHVMATLARRRCKRQACRTRAHLIHSSKENQET